MAPAETGAPTSMCFPRGGELRMSLWGVWAAMAKRNLERARNFEREQERRLLEAYTRGRKKARQRKRRDRKKAS